MTSFVIGSANTTGLIRFQPVSKRFDTQGRGSDIWDKLQWVPQSCHASGTMPEGVLIFGVPWFLAARPCAP
eukprot:5317416-Lingulodinium_polyedra.AAC.1